MNLTRGILLIAAGAFLAYRGWQIQTHPTIPSHLPVWVFYAFGIFAILLGIWRLTRKPPKPLV